MINKLFLFFFLVSCKTFAFETVACSHPEICRLISHTTLNQVPTKSLIVISGDPHEFEPSSNQVKELLTAKILVVGPQELNPWIKKILYQRAKDKSIITFNLEINETISKKYSTNKEPLSHFWLYPEIYCDMKKQLAEWIIFKQNKIATNLTCNYESQIKSLETSLQKITTPIVLSHDALLPLLNYHSKNKLKVLTLKGSGHHDDVSPQAIKELYNALKFPKVIWVFEKNINIPTNIASKIRNTDKQINIDTAISENTTKESDEFPTLTHFINELNK